MIVIKVRTRTYTLVSPRRTETETVRQEQILSAARKVFREKGYEGATISGIVKEAGVAQGTFYLYFPSKRDAFFALGQRVHEIMACGQRRRTETLRRY